MHKIYFLLICLGLLNAAQPQEAETKGIILNVSSKNEKKGTTRALIVGVSDYQQIDGLQYADRDAEEFSNYLLTNANWKLAPENLVLLTNAKAKTGNVITWLTWLMDQSKEGDIVIFYFSGHGDVETVGDISKGFLLTHDSPKNNYIAGALGVDMLQTAFSEMLTKGIKVYIIIDACRSGHLAGGSAGVKQTAKAFSQQWKNETKILSAQPDEVSFEGPQWGEGRGVFSFFLMKGLNGFADLNKDSMITLAELEQYVGLQVSEDTKYKQQPVFEGASKFSNKVSKSDTAGMNRYGQWNNGTDVSVFVLKKKGSLLYSVDSLLAGYPMLRQLLADSGNTPMLIEKALEDYEEIQKHKVHASLQERIRYLTTGALMNYLQQLINQSLVGKTLVGKDMQLYALTLVQNIQEINKNHKIINDLHLHNIRRYFFIHSISAWEDLEAIHNHRVLLNAMLDSALATEPNAAYLLHTKALVFTNTGQYDSASFYLKKTIDSSPTWLMPKYALGQVMESSGDMKAALKHYEQVLAMDSIFQTFECAKCFYLQMGPLYQYLKMYKQAEEIYLKAYQTDTASLEILQGLFDIAVIKKEKTKMEKWLGKIQAEIKTPEEQLSFLQIRMINKLVGAKEALVQLDSLEYEITSKAGQLYFHYTKGLYKEVYNIAGPLEDYTEAYYIDPFDFEVVMKILELNIYEGYFDEASEIVDSSLARFTGWRLKMVEYYQAVLYAYNGREAESIHLFMNLIKQGLVDCNEVRKIKPLKKEADFKRLEEYCK